MVRQSDDERSSTADTRIDARSAVGYVDSEGLPDLTVAAIERQMRAWSSSRGVCLRAIFAEFRDGSRSAFEELLTELECVPTRWVVVPSWEHVAVPPLLQMSMVERLERRTGVDVVAMTDHSAGPALAGPGRVGS